MIVFFMINFVGDPVDMLVNPESLPEEIDRVRKDFGLDQPVHVQYWKFLQGAITGNLGNSFIFGRPALALIVERFPATLELATCALIIAIVVYLLVLLHDLTNRPLCFVSSKALKASSKVCWTLDCHEESSGKQPLDMLRGATTHEAMLVQPFSNNNRMQ